MKIKLHAHRLLIYSSAIVLFFACRKSLDTYNSGSYGSGSNGILGQQSTDSTQILSSQDSTAVPFPTTVNYGCHKSPDYGDSIIYPQPTPPLQDYLVNPLNNPGKGTYFSWPVGLSINSATGAIDVTQSATGQRYTIGFVQNGTKDTCLTNLIIGGAAFSDSIYTFSQNQKKANPYYDANPNITSICNGSGVSGPGCSWDFNGFAKLQKVIVDNHTGVIDLEKTLNGGAFGLSKPIDGTSILVDIYYSLNDQSNMAIQHTPVKLIYYDKKSSIPQYLLDQISAKRTNILDQVLISLGGNPRPPLIIITRDN